MSLDHSPGIVGSKLNLFKCVYFFNIATVKTYETLFSEFDTISEAFTFLTSTLYQLLQNKDFYGIRRSCIEQINSPNGVQLSPVHVAAIIKTKNLTQLFEILTTTPYWSWIDVRLIRTMAYASGNFAAINFIKSYCEVVYSKKLIDILPNAPSKKVKEAYYNKVALFLNKDPNDMTVTVAYLVEYRSQLEPVITDILNGECMLEHLDQLSIPEDQLKKGTYIHSYNVCL